MTQTIIFFFALLTSVLYIVNYLNALIVEYLNAIGKNLKKENKLQTQFNGIVFFLSLTLWAILYHLTH